MKPTRFILSFALAFLALAATTAFAAPPANDNFANRALLSGQTVTSAPVPVDEATREPAERQDTGTRTLWYTWTAPQDGSATITTAGTSFRFPILSVFNGDDYSRLILVDQVQDNPSESVFSVKQGLVYQICVGVNNDDARTGTVTVSIINRAPTITTANVVATPAGTNDNFVSAVPLSGPTVTAFTYAREASRESLEPSFTGAQTVWWTWTAPADVVVTMNHLGGNNADNGGALSAGDLNVFNGTTLTDLTLVASGSGSGRTLTFPAKAGSVFIVCVGDENYVNGDKSPDAVVSVLNITTAPLTVTSSVLFQSTAAANDSFGNAQDLGGNATVSAIAYNDSASVETLEPTQNGAKTVWWTWTAPQDGVLALTARGTDFDHVLFAYTGGSLAALQSAGGLSGSPSNPSGGSINVVGGTPYHFVIGSSRGGSGTAVLTLAFTPGLSHVSVAAAATPVHETSTHVVTFVLTRDGDLSKPIVVNYMIKSSAGVGGGSRIGKKKIKAGKATAKVNGLVGLLNGYGSATVQLSLKAGDDYQLGSPAKAKIKVLRN